MKNRVSLILAAAACLAFVAGPALAADNMMDHKKPEHHAVHHTMHHAKHHKPMHHAAMHHGRHQASCYDYAWQSQDMKDCLAHHK